MSTQTFKIHSTETNETFLGNPSEDGDILSSTKVGNR